ncbi:MAG: trimethylamine methyltransferase, partial [Rhizobium sp.]
MTEAAIAERADRRGRAGRSARRDGGSKPHGVPYIVRNIPPYDLLSEENLQKIERTADRILAEIGIEFRDDPEAIEHWKRAGADVGGVRVKFEPGMLREIVASA